MLRTLLKKQMTEIFGHISTIRKRISAALSGRLLHFFLGLDVCCS